MSRKKHRKNSFDSVAYIVGKERSGEKCPNCSKRTESHLIINLEGIPVCCVDCYKEWYKK